MFQFARSDIQGKIDKYQVKYNQEMENSIDYEKVQKRIDQLLKLKNRIDYSKKKLCFFGIGTALSLFSFGVLGILGGITNILPISFIASISFVTFELKTALNQRKYQQKVQTEYSDLICLSYEELKEKSRHFSDCSFKAYHQAMKYRDFVRSLELKLTHMSRYENILEEFQYLSPYYLADSKSEYEELMKDENLLYACNNNIKVLLQDYLNQPMDSSSIHFDHQISTPIDYTEKTKSLMKSYKKFK